MKRLFTAAALLIPLGSQIPATGSIISVNQRTEQIFIASAHYAPQIEFLRFPAEDVCLKGCAARESFDREGKVEWTEIYFFAQGNILDASDVVEDAVCIFRSRLCMEHDKQKPVEETSNLWGVTQNGS